MQPSLNLSSEKPPYTVPIVSREKTIRAQGFKFRTQFYFSSSDLVLGCSRDFTGNKVLPKSALFPGLLAFFFRCYKTIFVKDFVFPFLLCGCQMRLVYKATLKIRLYYFCNGYIFFRIMEIAGYIQ